MGNTGLVIQGEVRDSTGNPIADARVMLAAAPGPYADVAQLTDPNGEFAMTVSAMGTYEVLCMTDAHGQSRQTVEVRPGKTARLQFHMQ